MRARLGCLLAFSFLIATFPSSFAGVPEGVSPSPQTSPAPIFYPFCFRGSPCADGSYPTGGLTMDAAGNLYGTTFLGGSGDGGVVFMLTPNDSKTAWTQKVLHAFC